MNNYYLIQYIPNPTRQEALNMGLLVYYPQTGTIDIQMLADTRNICKYFAIEDIERFNAEKQAVFNNLCSHAIYNNLDSLQSVIDSFGDNIRVTKTQSIKIQQSQKVFEDLFKRLVE